MIPLPVSRLLSVILAFFAVGVASAASAYSGAGQETQGYAHPWQANFQQAVTPVMERLHTMTHYLHIIAIVISVFVLALLIYVCIRFRANRNPVASKTTHNTWIEIIWTVVPIIILVAIAIPSLRLHYFMDVPPKADMTLKVIGYQWYWNYEYPDQGLQFDSNMKAEKDLLPGQPRLLAVDNPIVVPVNKNVHVLVTGGDVIHAFAMPAFGVKIDAMPGRLNETWFRAEKEGIYYGQCSELCGRLHGFMPIEIHVVSQEAFDAWVEGSKEKFSTDASPLTAEPVAKFASLNGATR